MKVMKYVITTTLLTVCIGHAQLRITRFDSAGNLTWTNGTGSAAYRVEFAPSLAGPYNTLTNIASSQSTNSIQSGAVPASGIGFYRITWADAPPAAPLGTWNYQGFSGSSLVVTGALSFTAMSPLSGTYTFAVITNSASIHHPVGSGTIANGSIAGSNTIEIAAPLRENFRLSGQMVLDEYWGNWSFSEIQIGFPWGGSRVVTRSGTFIARRGE